ncbi:TetR family transcriptional regulator [Flavobacterium noncentrifugens]|uniref:Transcriptional regulator, TetR family n=1 Tax=Flavobacterium noncentrifugens TaxID=1128970 RepID=A0A1G9ALA6_9FLAO|nr:TetR/AcrR family transcriptional regulator [Flavobacterium noncentrifugens]GEP51469.1 TetR family transcriptional regulator [Flavobacterium noncentrifugens]SDK27295.1 transcriptional regulator, TetR family [Flavobacterium noncentrifugens]
MKEKIIEKATDMFLKLGFKSITMDDIAGEMCISKKTIYKYFINKEVLIAESTETLNRTVMNIIDSIIAKNYNPIEENFEIRRIFKGIFQSTETSPLYQLKKHYPEIYEKVVNTEFEECYKYLVHNVEKGIAQGYYREGIHVEQYSRMYYMLTFAINENIKSEKEARDLELAALEYHTRAMSTPKGLSELEKQLSNPNI